MAIPQIDLYDYFLDWRTKINSISNLVGDIENIGLLETDRESVVDALNKIISNNGTLSSLTTTVKTNLVAAINELDSSIGNLTNLKTTTTSSLVNAVNEIFESLLISDISFTMQSEIDNKIRISAQLKNKEGNNLSHVASVQIYLSDNLNGNNLCVTEPSGGWSIGTTGFLIPIVANKSATVVTNSTGIFDIDITETAAKSFYLVIILPLGNLIISPEIEFAT